MALMTQMLRGNYHPQHSGNLAQISHLLQQAQSELQRYDSEILSVNIHRAELLRCILGYESLLSPIRKLPDDVLQEIFLRVCRKNTISGRNDTYIPGLVLSEVCSYWRELAVGARRLWSCFEVFLFDSEGTGEEAQSILTTELTKMLLERSGNAPLDVNIYHSWGENSHPIYDLLAQNAQRLEHFYLDAYVGTLKSLSPMKGNLPILQSLGIQLIGDSEYSDVIDIFQDAPLLQDVHLECFAKGVVTTEIKFVMPWHQLKSLSCHSLPPHLFSSILSSLDGGQLEELSYRNCGDDHVAPVTMPHLRNLYFMLGPPLNNLKCPNLENLRIGNCGSGPIFASSLTFLDTASNIISLHLTNVLIPQESLSSILRAFRRLESLTYFGFAKNWVPMMETLGVSDSTPLDASTAKLLPDLKHLSISLCDMAQIFKFEQSFVRMVTSHWVPSSIGADDSVSGLQSVCLHVPGQTLDSSLLDPLRVLVHAGLKVSVRDKSGVLI